VFNLITAAIAPINYVVIIAVIQGGICQLISSTVNADSVLSVIRTVRALSLLRNLKRQIRSELSWSFLLKSRAG
jgi:hypothetical protein